MEKVKSIVKWDTAGEKGGPRQGEQIIEVPETWDELKSLPQEYQDDLLKAAVTQYVTTCNNRYRENVLAIPQRDSRKALKHWLFRVCLEKDFGLHGPAVEKLLNAKVNEKSRKAINKFLDKVNPQD
jgi:hypothetical protein